MTTILHHRATFVLVSPGIRGMNSHTNSRLSTLVDSHATLVLVSPGHQSYGNSLTNFRLSTLTQLLFSFQQDIRVMETLIQTLPCQLSSTLMQLLFSFDQDMRVEKLSYKLSLVIVVNSHLSRTQAKNI